MLRARCPTPLSALALDSAPEALAASSSDEVVGEAESLVVTSASAGAVLEVVSDAVVGVALAAVPWMEALAQ